MIDKSQSPPPITLAGMKETIKGLQPLPKLPKILAGQPCDKILDAMGIKTSPEIERGIALLGGAKVEFDPNMPPNTLRFAHPDGRNDFCMIDKDGVVRNLALPSLNDMMKQLRTTMEVK